MNSSAEIFLAKQRGVKSAGQGKWKCYCPVQEATGEHDPSLNVAIGDNGDVIAHCPVCDATFVDMVHASNLTMAEVFEERNRHTKATKTESKAGLRFQKPELAIKFLEQKIGKFTAKWAYVVNGETVCYVARFDPLCKEKEFRPISRNGNAWEIKAPAEPRPLYRGDDIVDGCTIYVCEGEKACDAARSIGLIAVSPMNGAKSPHKTDWSKVKGHDVVILRDNDQAGIEFAAKVAELCTKAGAA